MRFGYVLIIKILMLHPLAGAEMKTYFTRDHISNELIGKEKLIFIGVALNEGSGPVLKLRDSNVIRLEGMPAWPPNKLRKTVLIIGTLEKRDARTDGHSSASDFILSNASEVDPK